MIDNLKVKWGIKINLCQVLYIMTRFLILKIHTVWIIHQICWADCQCLRWRRLGETSW
jgi:hypothetical protein